MQQLCGENRVTAVTSERLSTLKEQSLAEMNSACVLSHKQNNMLQ